MRQFLLYLFTLYLVFGGSIIFVNFIIDPAHIYHDGYIEDIIKGISQGKNVTNVTDLNEREYKLRLAELYRHKSYDYLVMGSSRVMQISNDCYPNDILLNMGVSSCKIKDFKALYQILKDNDVRYKTLLLGVDPIIFNKADDERVTMWKSIAKYYYEYEGITYEEERNWDIINNLFSISYFNQSLETIQKKIKGDKNSLLYVETATNEGATQRIDGSITYPLDKRDTPQNNIDNSATNAIQNHLSYKGFDELSPNYISDFCTFLDKIHDDGIEVIFVFVPFHPYFYDGLSKNAGFVKGTQCLKKIARERDIAIIGSYNPNSCGFTNTGFLDSSHPRKETIDSLFKQYNNIE